MGRVGFRSRDRVRTTFLVGNVVPGSVLLGKIMVTVATPHHAKEHRSTMVKLQYFRNTDSLPYLLPQDHFLTTYTTLDLLQEQSPGEAI